jgi:hypothetical protein
MRRRGPLADSYAAAVALVICALVPFLTLTAAVLPLSPLLSKSLGMSKAALDVTVGLSDAGYACSHVIHRHARAERLDSGCCGLAGSELERARHAARCSCSPGSGQRRPSVQYLSMLSSGRPLVSGTKRATKTMASPAKMA